MERGLEGRSLGEWIGEGGPYFIVKKRGNELKRHLNKQQKEEYYYNRRGICGGKKEKVSFQNERKEKPKNADKIKKMLT